MDAGCVQHTRYMSIVICACDHVVNFYTWFRADAEALTVACQKQCPWCHAKTLIPEKYHPKVDSLDHGHTEFLGGPAVIQRTGMTSSEYVSMLTWEAEMGDASA